jgi:hypothetical protein
MITSAVILSIVILVGVFSSDIGERAITSHRLLRPLIIAAAAGALYLTSFATSGDGLALELAGPAVGALLGLLAAAFMRVERHRSDGRIVTRAGIGYALVWIVVIAARLAFIYGSQHWFSAELGSWMLAHHVTADALTDALVLMALAMTTTRTLSLLIRSRAHAGSRPADVRIVDASV